MKIYPITYTDDYTATTEFGPISKGRGLNDVVTISIWVVAACATRRQAVCGPAQQNLRGGTGYVTQDGMFILQNAAKQVVYELFPAVYPEGTPIYLGVKRGRPSHL